MIKIFEDKSRKVPGFTSFFIQFDYNKEIIKLFSDIDCKYFHKKDALWEIPLVNLQAAVDILTLFDDIDINILEYKEIPYIDYHIENKGKTKLFKHQIEAVNYGLNYDKWLLLDLPGCGKSLSSITLAKELKERRNIKHCIIICGLNSLKFNWIKEIKKHSDLSATILGQRINTKGKLVIGSVQQRLDHLKSDIEEFFIVTNIETLRNPEIAEEINKHPDKFPFIIFDEVHKCKDPGSQAGDSLLKIKDCKYLLPMTGTLLLNNPLDAYVPLHWTDNDRSTYTNFKNLFCNMVGEKHNIVAGFKHLDYLSYIISQCSLRRSNYKDLPPLQIITEYIEMEDSQKDFYENIKNGIIDQVDKVPLNASNILAMTTRLRQATALPSILTSEHIPSAKIDRACELVESIVSNNEKVVIFSTFKPTVEALGVALQDYNPVITHGDIKDNLLEVKDDFENDPDKKVFICTWEKAGTGIDITKASYCIFIDTPWTWGVFEQAYKRVHRTGVDQNKTVFVFELVTAKTFDEDVHDILYDKQALSDFVIDHDMSDNVMQRLKRKLIDL